MFDNVADASIEENVLRSREDFGNWTIRFPDRNRVQAWVEVQSKTSRCRTRYTEERTKTAEDVLYNKVTDTLWSQGEGHIPIRTPNMTTRYW